VNRRAGSVVRLATPVKAWTQRFALLFLAGIAVALMLLDKADSVVVERARSAVADAVAPILDAASRPVESFNNMVEQAGQLVSVAAENADLREQNERLQRWQTVARRLEAENEALRATLNLVPEPTLNYVTARVIADQGGAFVRSVLLSAGAREGVQRGQAALTSDGLAGRVAEVGNGTSRVLLVTDMNSRIPILVGDVQDRAMLVGDNTTQPLLRYLEPRVEVKPGDRVTTSGHGGVFPPGLPVGRVASVGEDGIRVQPFVDWGHMQYLRLVDYELPGILSSFDGSETPGNGR
jgi:rod shape-determining protein MreC